MTTNVKKSDFIKIRDKWMNFIKKYEWSTDGGYHEMGNEGFDEYRSLMVQTFKVLNFVYQNEKIEKELIGLFILMGQFGNGFDYEGNCAGDEYYEIASDFNTCFVSILYDATPFKFTKSGKLIVKRSGMKNLHINVETFDIPSDYDDYFEFEDD